MKKDIALLKDWLFTTLARLPPLKNRLTKNNLKWTLNDYRLWERTGPDKNYPH